VIEWLESLLPYLPWGEGWPRWAWVGLDVLLVSYLVYRALLLIRGTRALQMLIGLSLVVAGVFVADRVGLTTIHWLLESFIANIILVVVVLFQNDIRRGLTRVGRNPFFGRLSQIEETTFFEELCRAAANLAREHTGALIVIQREADLTQYTEDGVRLDARVSHELLQTLFQPQSPIHDGAVVIQHGRIASAGCFLPLTVNPRVSKTLGTRHRAAIGLTEENDSVVLVMSEERGQVSLVTGGKITRDLDTATLRKVLQTLFRPPRRTGFLRRRAAA